MKHRNEYSGRDRPRESRTSSYAGRPRDGNRNVRGARSRKCGDSRKGFWLVLILIVFLILLIGFILVSFMTSLFNVSSIELSEEGKYSLEEIISVSGIKMSEKIYKIDTGEAKENILSEFPDIVDVKIKKKLPSEILITITYDTPVYYVKVTDEYYTLSSSLYVLERYGKYKDIKTKDLIELVLPPLWRVVVGEDLRYMEDEASVYVDEVIDSFIKSDFAEEADRLVIRNKFDVSIVKKGNYRIILGNIKEMPLKLKMASKVLREGNYLGQDGVTVDASNAAECAVRVDKTEKIE